MASRSDIADRLGVTPLGRELPGGDPTPQIRMDELLPKALAATEAFPGEWVSIATYNNIKTAQSAARRIRKHLPADHEAAGRHVEGKASLCVIHQPIHPNHREPDAPS